MSDNAPSRQSWAEACDWLVEARRLTPDPIHVLDYQGGVGVIVQAGLERYWYRLDGRGGAARIRPSDDPLLPLRVALHRDPACEVLAYTPRQQLVLRRRSPTGVVVERGYRPGGRSLALSRHRIATSALAGASLRAPRLLGCAAERESIILQDLGGSRPFVGSRSTEVFRVLGAGVRRLQEVRASGCLPVVGNREVIDDLDGWVGKLKGLGIDPPAGWSRCRAEVERLLHRLGDVGPVLCHRNFDDRQVVVAGQRVGILDFGGLCLADPALDPGTLLAHLELRVLQGVDGAGTEALAGLSAAFLQGWGREQGTIQERVRAFRSASLLRLALTHSLQPQRSSVVPALVRRCRRWLGD